MGPSQRKTIYWHERTSSLRRKPLTQRPGSLLTPNSQGLSCSREVHDQREARDRLGPFQWGVRCAMRSRFTQGIRSGGDDHTELQSRVFMGQ